MIHNDLLGNDVHLIVTPHFIKLRILTFFPFDIRYSVFDIRYSKFPNFKILLQLALITLGSS